MRKLLVGVVGLALCGLMDAEPQVITVGDGRLVCRGTVRECESIQRRNDARELERLQKQWLAIEQGQKELRQDDAIQDAQNNKKNFQVDLQK